MILPSQKNAIPRLALLLCIVALSFFKWAFIPSFDTYINGLNTEGTTLGKPAIFLLICCTLNALSLLLPHPIKKPLSILSAALLLAWQIRNWFMLSICQLGECLEITFYFYTLCAVVVVLFIETVAPKSKR